VFSTPTGAVIGMSGALEMALDPIGLTLWQFRILAFCAHRPSTPSDVASWRTVKKQAVSRHLNALVELGFLERRAETNDRRRIVHHVTPAGVKALERGQKAMNRTMDSVLRRLDTDAATDARQGLEQLGAALTSAWFDLPIACDPPSPTRTP
jgi:DNA-binding MarR family transcriptional regulator